MDDVEAKYVEAKYVEAKYISLFYTSNTSVDAPLDLSDVYRRAMLVFGPGTTLVSCIGVGEGVKITFIVHGDVKDNAIMNLLIAGWKTFALFHSTGEDRELKFCDRSVSDVAIELATSHQVATFSCTSDGLGNVKAFATLMTDLPLELTFDRSRKLNGPKRSPTTKLIISSHPYKPDRAVFVSCRREDFEEYCETFSCGNFMILRYVSDQHVSFVTG